MKRKGQCFEVGGTNHEKKEVKTMRLYNCCLIIGD